jgi:LruC domain-containing protein
LTIILPFVADNYTFVHIHCHFINFTNTFFMNTFRLKSKISTLFAALVIGFSLQSCNKEADKATPSDVTATADTWCTPVTPPSCKQVALISQNQQVGTVDVGTNNGDIYLTYNITKPNLYLLEAHSDIFSTMAQFRSCGKVSSYCVYPDRFLFSRAWSCYARTTTYTVVIPRIYAYLVGCGDCFNVAGFVELSNGGTAWAGTCTKTTTGVAPDLTKSFGGSTWSTYFEFCKSECDKSIDFTYAWEDVNSSANDADYNDVVMQSTVVKSATELKIDFLATARGATFDHKFKFRVPKAGVTGIVGAASYTQDATYYYVTVFESTKQALPSSPGSVFSNTEPQLDCVPFAAKEITLTLNSSFVYNAAKPFEPFITVFNSGNALAGTGYDLYIYSVSNRDTWTSTAGKVFPSGIVIPADWRWPVEGVSVTRPYPNFTSITDGFNTTWFNNLATPELTFDKTACNN